jgi:site-specific recombinase XerD
MKITKFEDKITFDFLAYLHDQGVSSLTLKNYKSDISNFTGWLIQKVRSLGVSADHLTECVPFISQSFAKEYCDFMLLNATSSPTVNRRLSTLRHLAHYLAKFQVIDFDFMANFSNLNTGTKKDDRITLVDEFASYLAAQKASDSTIKNYLSDVKHFLSWVEAKQ